jgi:hypothetical protein
MNPNKEEAVIDVLSPIIIRILCEKGYCWGRPMEECLKDIRDDEQRKTD